MRMDDLQELYVHELRDLYSAENQLTKAMPKMVKKAKSPQLKAAFGEHLAQTRGHVTRLEGIFNRLGCKAERETCEAMKGLIAEGDELIGARGDPNTRDAGLIAAAQKVEHYEIAGYGTVRTWAQELGMDDVARTLQQTLDEEGEADKRLTRIAEGRVNVRAQTLA